MICNRPALNAVLNRTHFGVVRSYEIDEKFDFTADVEAPVSLTGSAGGSYTGVLQGV